MLRSGWRARRGSSGRGRPGQTTISDYGTRPPYRQPASIASYRSLGLMLSVQLEVDVPADQHLLESSSQMYILVLYHWTDARGLELPLGDTLPGPDDKLPTPLSSLITPPSIASYHTSEPDRRSQLSRPTLPQAIRQNDLAFLRSVPAVLSLSSAATMKALARCTGAIQRWKKKSSFPATRPHPTLPRNTPSPALAAVCSPHPESWPPLAGRPIPHRNKPTGSSRDHP